MAVGTIQNEGDLARFVEKALEPIRAVIRQVQGKVLVGDAPDPNGEVAAKEGTAYLSLAGGAGTTLWVKESGGTGDTGWVGK